MKAASIIFAVLVLLGLALHVSLGGRDPGWSATSFAFLLSHDEYAGDIADSRWVSPDEVDIDDYEGSFWLRTFVDLRAPGMRHLLVAGTATYDLWWDGEFVGRNGRLAPDGTEVEIGRIDSLFSLPERLSAMGTHTLVLRVNRDSLAGGLSSGGIDFIQDTNFPYGFMSQVAVAILTAAFALGSGAVYLILSFRHPTRVQAIYIGFCLVFCLLATAEAWRDMFGYTYPWHVVRMEAIAVLTVLTGILLNAVLIAYFGFRRQVWPVAALTLVLLVVYGIVGRQTDTFGAIASAISVGLACVTCSVAAQQKHPGAPLLLSCLAGGLVINLLNLTYVDEWGLFAVFLLFTTAVNFSLARDMREIAQSLAEVQLRSLRLRQELYRRFIQPHFMLNTLTTISEWIATAPDQAETAVSELAGEVRILGRMIDKDFVALSEELDLCDLHCKVMSRRLRTDFCLERAGELRGTIPPATLHTLVENVFAHNRYTGPAIALRLECTMSGGERILRLTAPRGDAAASRSADGPGGLQYVRARLAEAYGEAWTLTILDEADHWIAEMQTPAEIG